MVLLPSCPCCGCSGECCRTKTYGYMDTEPKGKWYDECPDVGDCQGKGGSCGNDVLDGFIVERFCKESIKGKQIKAKLRKNSAIDDFGSVAGIDTDKQCGRLGVITADHEITAALVIEEDPDDSNYKLAKVPFRAVNANHGGPYGLAGVTICWCCVEDGDPPCDCCKTDPPPPPPKKYGCVDWKCVEVGDGDYDEPTCGGECDDLGYCCTDYGISTVKRTQCSEWGGTFYTDYNLAFADCGCDCDVGGDYCLGVTDDDLDRCDGSARPDSPDGQCGPGPNSGLESEYYASGRWETGGPVSLECAGDCPPLADLFAKNARIIGWYDQAEEFSREASDECCVGKAKGTRLEYRVFALNCRKQEWEEAPNVMAVFNTFIEVNFPLDPAKFCYTATGDYPPGTPSTPQAEVRYGTRPTCVPPEVNPLP